MKSKSTASILAFVSAFTCIPLHHFYLGNIGLVVLYTILWFLAWCFCWLIIPAFYFIIPFIIFLIEGFNILNMTEEAFDAKYNGKYTNVQTNNAPPVTPAIPATPVNSDVQASVNSQSAKDKLVELKELLDQGILTQEEFDKQKEKVLNS